MRLITGGAYQGKLEYAMNRFGIEKEQIVDGAYCRWEELVKAPLADHFHLWIKRRLEAGDTQETECEPKAGYKPGTEYGLEAELEEQVRLLLIENPDIILIVDELGCGIVPMDAFDRNYREVTGRICCRLAGEAKEVHRVICGIGTVIKSD